MPQNDYGVYRIEEGDNLWVSQVSPLTEGDAEHAQKYSEQDAMTTATYLTSVTDYTYFIGHVPPPHH